MSFTMKAGSGGGGGGEKAPAGNHPAVLVALIDLGSQHHEFQGKASWRRDCYLVWELPTKKNSAGQTFLVAEAVTLSLNEKAKLRGWLEGMLGLSIPDGQEFDVTKALGQSCLLNVLHTEKGYPYVKAVTQYPEGLPPPVATRKAFSCTLSEFQKGKEIPEWVPWTWSKALSKMASVSDVIGASKELAGDGPAAPVAAGESTSLGQPVPF